MWHDYDPEQCAIVGLLRTRFDVRICDQPDYLLYSTFGDDFLRHKCLRIMYTGENERPHFDECDYAFTFDHNDHPDHYRWPLYARYGDLRQLVKPDGDAWRTQAIPPRFCNFVYSNGRCRTRNRFFHLLSQYKRVDAGGRLFNNLGGRVPHKRDFIAQYKFTIAFENSSYPGYVTEKIAEPMWAGSLPIYWGNPLVHLDFNPRSFISFYDHSGLETLVRRVIEVDQNDDLYREYLRQPWFHDNLAPSALDPESVLDQFERIFTTPRIPIAVRQPRNRSHWRTWWKPWRHWKPVKTYLNRWLKAA